MRTVAVALPYGDVVSMVGVASIARPIPGLLREPRWGGRVQVCPSPTSSAEECASRSLASGGVALVSWPYDVDAGALSPLSFTHTLREKPGWGDIWLVVIGH